MHAPLCWFNASRIFFSFSSPRHILFSSWKISNFYIRNGTVAFFSPSLTSKGSFMSEYFIYFITSRLARLMLTQQNIVVILEKTYYLFVWKSTHDYCVCVCVRIWFQMQKIAITCKHWIYEYVAIWAWQLSYILVGCY